MRNCSIFTDHSFLKCKNVQAIIKPQYVDHIPKAVKGTVARILTNKDERKVKEEMYDILGTPFTSRF